eukprot:4576845-Prorocentrum_lima.AAC.1
MWDECRRKSGMRGTRKQASKSKGPFGLQHAALHATPCKRSGAHSAGIAPWSQPLQGLFA